MLWHKAIGAGGAGGVPFDPSQLATTLAWFDASDTSTVTYIEGGTLRVTSWTDKIGAVSATRSGSNAVSYDNEDNLFIAFDGSQGNGLTNTTTRFGLSANPDIFIASVFEVPEVAESRLLTLGDLNGDGVFVVSTDISWRFNNGAAVFSENVTTDTLQMLVWQRSAGTNYGASTAFLNGTELTIASTTNPTTSPTNTVAEFGIGTGFDLTSTGDFNGNIYEIVICESSVEADRQKIEGYLAHKHGLTGLLPIGHPYKSSAP